jgi:hypothetical protein
MKKFIFLLLFVTLVFGADAHAYLDGGTGSMLLQILLGGIAGAATIIKLYWYKIVGFFKKEKPTNSKE